MDDLTQENKRNDNASYFILVLLTAVIAVFFWKL
jgi:hypothetical protein